MVRSSSCPCLSHGDWGGLNILWRARFASSGPEDVINGRDQAQAKNAAEVALWLASIGNVLFCLGDYNAAIAEHRAA